MSDANTIIRAVAEHYKVPIEPLIAPPVNGRRAGNPRYDEARRVAMHLVREMTGASYPEIARIFNRNNHTTIIHACRTAAEQVEPAVFAAIRERLAHGPPSSEGCAKCKQLMIELAALKIEILEMRARQNGCG